MHVAILTRPQFRSPHFLAGSLARMLAGLGVSHTVHTDGIGWLEAFARPTGGLRAHLARRRARAALTALEGADLFVLCDTLQALRPAVDLAPLRAFGRPVLLHSVFYVGGSEHWLDRLPEGALDKYDAFLTVSGLHDVAPREPDRYQPIGLALDTARPVCRPREFMALLDFPREGYEAARAVQVRALERAGVPSIELEGEYSFDDIRALYDRVGLAFVAFPEAFGVPVVELQFAGALNASPDPLWVKRHALLPPGGVFDPAAEFSDNFVFYAGEDDLVRCLESRRDAWDPAQVRARLEECQPAFVRGDAARLAAVLERFEQGNGSWRTCR